MGITTKRMLPKLCLDARIKVYAYRLHNNRQVRMVKYQIHLDADG